LKCDFGKVWGQICNFVECGLVGFDFGLGLSVNMNVRLYLFWVWAWVKRVVDWASLG
jgi:hypothetical protein